MLLYIKTIWPSLERIEQLYGSGFWFPGIHSGKKYELIQNIKLNVSTLQEEASEIQCPETRIPLRKCPNAVKKN